MGRARLMAVNQKIAQPETRRKEEVLARIDRNRGIEGLLVVAKR